MIELVDMKLHQQFVDLGLTDYDITKKMRMSYKAGVSYRLKISHWNYAYISGFANYHKDYGIVNYDDEIFTRNIDYILSYGLTFGIGFELNHSIKY